MPATNTGPINWSHPLSSGLIALGTADGDAVTGSQWRLLPQTDFVQTPHGTGVRTGAAGSGAAFDIAADILLGRTHCTMSIWAALGSQANYSTLLSIPHG